MESPDFLDVRRELFEFHAKGGIRGLQGRFPLDRALAPLQQAIDKSLREQFAERCAYSEVHADGTDRPLRLVWHRPTNDAAELDGRVDHDHYWWLTLEWQNWYLASAFIESVKSYQFPVVGDRSPTKAPPEDRPLDTAVLLDPCRDEPAWWLRFDGNGGVQPRLHPSAGERERFRGVQRGEVTVRVLDLDNDELRTARRETNHEFVTSELWNEPGGAIVDEVLDGRWPHRGSLLQSIVDARVVLGTRENVDHGTLERLVERAPGVLGAALFDPHHPIDDPLLDAPTAVRDELADRLLDEFADLREHPRFAELFHPTSASMLVKERPTGAGEGVEESQFEPIGLADDPPEVSIGPTDRIRRVLIKNFRAIREVELTIASELLELPPRVDETGIVEHATPVLSTQWKVLLGENGSGKSSIMHAIALALTGDRLDEFVASAGLSWSKILRRPTDDEDVRQGRVLLEFTGGQKIDLRFTDSTAWFHGLRGGAPAMHINVRAYGATRLLQRSRPRTGDGIDAIETDRLLAELEALVDTVADSGADRRARLDAANEAALVLTEFKSAQTVHDRTRSPTTIDIGNLLDSNVPVIDATRWLCGLGNDEFNVAALALGDLLGEPSLVPSPGSTTRRRHVRRIARHPRRRPTTVTVDGDALEVVSDGYRAVIAVACDIMRGIGGLDTERGGISDLTRARGIVLIDEIGAHLHPRWRMRITDRLRRTFPNVQFVATTHEPLCLRGLQEQEVVRVSKWERWGVVLEAIERAPARYRVDQLLTSEFFGLDSAIDPEVDAKYRRYYELRRRTGPEGEISPELRQLDLELNQRLRPVLGYTRRDQMMYEAIDDFLAEEGEIEDPDERREQRIATVRKVADQWTRLRRARL
jgi:hypothetical protein